jgi:hypothetical protein
MRSPELPKPCSRWLASGARHGCSGPHAQAELVGAIADTRALFEGKGGRETCGARGRRTTHRGPAVTISLPANGETSEAQLEEDGFHMLWLVHRNRRNSGRVQILLSAALQIGWRIASASPEEQALVEAHGLASGRVQ